MDAKENAGRIIRFDAPERIVTGLPASTVAYYGCNHGPFEGVGPDGPVGTTWTTVFGTVMRKEQEGVMGFPQHHPLARPSDLHSYDWPDPDDERLCGPIHSAAAEVDRSDQFLSGSHRETLWEKAYMLVGMADLMTYFFTEPRFVRDVLHHIMEFDLGIARHYLDAGVDVAGLGDDLGTQIGPLLGPDIIEGFLVPEYRRLFDLYRNRDVIITFHSCGRIESVLGTFIDLGVDVLNPVQATANDLEKVRAVTAGRMALAGGVSSATVMAGPPEAIAAEARERMWTLGRDGGYFCGQDQGLPFPAEHVEALHQAVEEYGVYPLTPPPESK